MTAEATGSATAADEQSFGPVRVSRRSRVLVITLDRPEARNAVSPELARGLEAALDLLESDHDLWVGVLTAAGPVFCAGADLKAVAAGRLAEIVTERGGFAGITRRRRDKPVIVALAGDAYGGGLEIAIACDVILAEEGVRMGIPEAARSLMAGGGGLALLPVLIGEKPALEMAMTAAPCPVERLAELGLVSRVLPRGEVVAAAVAMAEQICANAPLAVRASRRAIVDCRDGSEDERYALGNREFAALRATEDFAEGPKAFIEKRPPRWSAR
ncbi:MAG: enoyl-CoA hydratase-related protein [Pseudonocardia sp.]|jgi:enoyl-CoA hydratase